MLRRHLGLLSTAALSGVGALAILAPTQAYAEITPTCQTVTGLAITDYRCIIGDKIYSNFKILQGNSILGLESTTYQFSNTDPNHTLTVSSSGVNTNFLPGTYQLEYTMEIDPLTPGFEFFAISTGTTTSSLLTTTWTKTLSAVPPTNPATVTVVNPNSQSGNAFFSQGVTSAVFTSTLEVGGPTGSFIATFTDSLTQTPAVKVPGPLPILGAGIAFGYSRKLRRRVSAKA